MWQDLRQSVRAFQKSRGFTVVAVLVLALGIGVNTAIFSVINAVLFRPPAARAPGELRYIYPASPGRGIPTYGDYQYLRASGVFADLAAVGTDVAKLGTGGDVEQVYGEYVSTNYFDVLGVRPVIGRTFVPAEDEAPGATPVVVISYELWRDRFRSDPGVLGQTLNLTHPSVPAADQWPTYTIVGVMPPDFTGTTSPLQPMRYWVPLVQRASDYRDPIRPPQTLGGSGIYFAVGRLRPGVSDARAQTAVASIGAQLRNTPSRARDKTWALVLLDSRRVRLPFDPRGEIVPGRLAIGLMLVAGIVLVIAAANLVGLLVARGVTRRSEIAVRLTLGASRWRLTRQLLVESLALAVAGGAIGLVFARALVVLFVNQAPTQFGSQLGSVPFALAVPIDARVLAFTAIACMAAGLVVGLAPARQAAKTDLLGALAGGAAGSTGRVRARLRHGVVIPQVCCSMALLLVAGVLVRPLIRAEAMDPGYQPGGLVAVDFDMPPPHQHRTDAELRAFLDARARFYHRLVDRVRGLAEVSSFSLTMGMPAEPLRAWVVDREVFPSGQHWWVAETDITSDYFRTLGIPFKAGRGFDLGDTPDSPPVAVVSETLARWLWPGKNAIGRYVGKHFPDSNYPPQWFEVVGVVGDAQAPLAPGPTPAIYRAIPQQKSPYALTIVARGHVAEGELIHDLKAAVVEAEPSAEIRRSGTVTATIDAQLYPRRMAAGILGVSGLIGLVMAAIGIYGVVSYSVAQRLREIGIRMTLGARRGEIMTLVISEGMKVTGIGSVAGFLLAFIALRVTRGTVASVPLVDTVAFAVVPLVLVAIILLACYLPARRAARVDPMVVLRNL